MTVTVRSPPPTTPRGAAQYLITDLGNKQYGFVKEVHVDADPAMVMTLLGSDADLLVFNGNLIPRTNTPGVYQDLITHTSRAAPEQAAVQVSLTTRWAIRSGRSTIPLTSPSLVVIP